jgi:hypothetical protein
MADRKISELADNATPEPDTASVPVIQAVTNNGITTYTQYRTTVRNLVVAGATGESLIDGGNF